MSSWFTGGWLIVSIILLLIGLGAVGTIVFLIAKGMLKCLWFTSWLMRWAWARLTSQPVSSHGSAHFADAAEVHASGLLNDTGFPLAQLQDGQILREPLSQHVSLCAPPRSHKSWGMIMPVLREWQGSCVVNDLRGELYTHTHDSRESYGPVFKFAPTERDSCSLNPLAWVRWGADQEYSDVNRVVHGLLSPEPGERMSEFAAEAVPFLTSLVLDRKAHQQGSFGAVLRFLTDPATTMNTKLDELLRSPLPLVASGARRMADKSDRQRGAILMALESALNTFSDPLIAQHTETSDLDIAAFQGALKPVSLFFCFEFGDMRRLRPLFSCLLEQMIARFGAHGQPRRRKVLLALDEAMGLGYLPSLEDGMAHLAGDGVQCLLAYQNRAQVAHVYGPHTPLLDSIPTSIFYTPEPMDRTTLDEISTALGTTTSTHATVTESRSLFGLLQRTMHGEQRHERPLMYPDEIARMPDEACIVMTKGAPPTMGLKLDASPAAILAMVQRSKPVVKRVALAAAACLVLVSVGAWALWPNPTSAPKLSLTSQGMAPSEDGTAGALHQARLVPSDPTTDRLALNVAENFEFMMAKHSIREPARFGLFEVVPRGSFRLPGVHPWSGLGQHTFVTLGACEAEITAMRRQQREANARNDASTRARGYAAPQRKPATERALLCSPLEDMPS